jgi:hypothetical protein
LLADGVTENTTFAQLTAVNADIAADGFTPTFTVNVAPVQVPPETDGTTKYVAVCITFDKFSKVPVILEAPLPLNPPLKLALYVGTDQLYVVFAGTTPFVLLTGVTWNNTPSQVIAVIAVITGVGFTVITTVKLLPLQPPLEGCIVYVTVSAVFNVLVNVPVIVELDPVNKVLVT